MHLQIGSFGEPCIIELDLGEYSNSSHLAGYLRVNRNFADTYFNFETRRS